MAITDIILDNYVIINSNITNNDLVANITVINDEALVNPTLLLLNNGEGSFYLRNQSLYVDDYSKLYTMLSDTRQIKIGVSGYEFTKDLFIVISGANCPNYSNNNDCCSVSGALIPSEEGLGFFNPLSSCYSGENQLYESLLEGAYNTAAIPAVFYVTNYDTSYDPILGEDPARKIVRKFDFNCYATDLPEEAQTFSNMFGGIQGLDKFVVYVSKKHFYSQSRKDYLGNPNSYPIYYPHGGEYIMFKYNAKYYEITNVGEQAEMHLQTKHSYTFNLKVYEDDRARFVPQTSASMVNDIMRITNNEKDIFNISDIVDKEKVDILYTSAAGEKPPNDPFVGW